MPSSASETKLKTYRVRFDYPGQASLVSQTVKAVSLEAAIEWADEWMEGEQEELGEWPTLYDISQLD